MKTTWIVTLGMCLSLFPFDASAQSQRAYNFKARLTGAEEVPAVETEARGHFLLHVNQSLTEASFKLVVRNGEDLLGMAGAHLHCATEGENGPVFAFLAGEAMPGFDGRIVVRATLNDDNIMEGTACGTTIADVVEAILEGGVYANVHSQANPGGEVRGQLR